MNRSDNREVLEFMVGCVIPKDLNDKAQAKCKEAGTTLYDAILTFIKALANDEISVRKKEE